MNSRKLGRVGRSSCMVALFCAWGCKEAPERAAPPAHSAATASPTSAPAVEPVASATASAAAPNPPPWSDRRVDGSGFPCAVEEVLATSCRRCHWKPRENDAPFSLLVWEDTRQMRSGKAIHVLMKQMVEADLMPPLDALVEPPVERLSAQHKQTLLTWLSAGAERATEVCAP